ncbi:phosphorylase b kinase regulatory subunit alpha, liver isoform-like isoform X2 [Clavelina lepadiformis]|uniref:phosphorylase b kinase regulatory subunit alpha, liver isoform-like isoform X2 n=1 Tax=Clavelina lepadiformis TaxID=159417 RepID=UPI004042A523
MRSRSNSGVKLDNYARIIQRSILKFQNPVTGLFSASKDAPHAWVRDNLYSLQAVWGLALAYRKHSDLDEDKAKSYELEQSVVKCMRSLLQCMIRQVDKLERFKTSQSPADALHAKYNRTTCGVVVGDHEWGHLQLDATGLYILMLAQMTASGLSIIYTLDEVAFIQNLVFYIAHAYRTPDYGIWERGDKTNHGVPELNASSVGMCKAALEAIDELNLFGPSGGPQSVIHVTPDEKALCQAILQSMLPRESNSKEVDAGLLSVIGYPAFAVNDQSLVDETKQSVVNKLQGKYGCRRFLRDGYKTALEDSSRLHYELAELKVFEHIECEWPVFWTYLVLDGIFLDNKQQVIEYLDALGEILVLEDGVRCVPELYAVPADKVEMEKANPHSQDRVPVGKLPHLWGHSLYILGKLLWDGFLAPGEIDPLNRRFATEIKPDIVIQVAVVAEENLFQDILNNTVGIHVETMHEITPIRVQPAKVLSSIYSRLGTCPKLKLSGRPVNQMGILATSKLYTIRGTTFAFTPNLLDQRDFYMSLDTDMLIDMLMTDLQYLASSWTMPGRPIITIPIHGGMLTDDGENFKPSLISTLRKIQSGYLYGVRVQLGTLGSFLSTSCLSRLTFLETEDRENDSLIDVLFSRPAPRRYRLGSVIEGLSLPFQHFHQSQADDSDQALVEARLSERHKHKRVSADLTHIATFNQQLLRQGSRKMWKSETLLEENNADDEELDPKVLVARLDKTNQLWEQADILHYLYTKKGPNWDTEIGGSSGALVSDLVEELYDRSGQQGNWMVVRQLTGLLQKRVSGLSQALTDLLVRQKQVTVGLPQEPRETTVTRPLPGDELHNIIMESFGEDTDIAVLTQEIIMYLAMFMRASPSLFNDLLRLRVGLIIQVMASELARHLRCCGEEASAHLMSLSPFEMKQLMHNILSGKEFGVIKSVRATSSAALYHEISLHTERSSKADKTKFHVLKRRLRRLSSSHSSDSSVKLNHKDLSGLISPPSWTQRGMSTDSQLTETSAGPHSNQNSVGSSQSEFFRVPSNYAQFTGQKRGQWVRRRRIDGALNRVPENFYSRIWRLLEKCYGVVISGHYIPGYVTKEMTRGELKFALLVENVLNHIPQPEYRQLVVETVIVLTLLADAPNVRFLSDNLNVDRVLLKASDLFYDDEVADEAPEDLLHKDPNTGVCTEFYDCAPSGPFGTMTYLSKAVASSFSEYFPDNIGDCTLS